MAKSNDSTDDGYKSDLTISEINRLSGECPVIHTDRRYGQDVAVAHVRKGMVDDKRVVLQAPTGFLSGKSPEVIQYAVVLSVISINGERIYKLLMGETFWETMSRYCVKLKKINKG